MMTNVIVVICIQMLIAWSTFSTMHLATIVNQTLNEDALHLHQILLIAYHLHKEIHPFFNYVSHQL